MKYIYSFGQCFIIYFGIIFLRAFLSENWLKLLIISWSKGCKTEVKSLAKNKKQFAEIESMQWVGALSSKLFYDPLTQVYIKIFKPFKKISAVIQELLWIANFIIKLFNIFSFFKKTGLWIYNKSQKRFLYCPPLSSKTDF